MTTTVPAALPPAPAAWPWPPLLRGSALLHAAAAGTALWAPETGPWALGGLVANHALLTAAGLWPRSRVLGPNVTRLPAAAGPTVALTFDDGPDPHTTPAVLRWLDDAGVRATFFCIAERARAQASLLREIVAAGHSVQNHSLRHRHDFSLLGPRTLERDIAAAQDLLGELTGVRPHCFRAPAGLRSPLLDPVLHRQGLNLVSWTRRGFDTRDRNPARVLARLTRRLGAGDILLLHDGHAQRSAAGRPVLLDVLPALLQRCHDAGLRPVTLTEALPPRHAPS